MLPEYWNRWEIETFLELTDGIPAMVENQYLQGLYHDAMWDLEIPIRQRDAAYNELVDFMREEYEIEFADEFDWEEFREWYSMQ